MNPRIKYGLLAVLFAIGLYGAYTAGALSGGDTDTPDTGEIRVQQERPEAGASTGANGGRSNKVSVVRQDTEGQGDREYEISADGDAADAAASDASPREPAAEGESFRPDPYLLRQKFPDNQALPPVDREELREKEEARERRNREYGRISANRASEAEIADYYAEQRRLAEDSIEVLAFILQEYGGQMSETDLKKHEFLLESFQKRLDRIPERKAEALERLRTAKADRE